MNEPLTDEEIQDCIGWVNGEYPQSYMSNGDFTFRLIATVESLKKDIKLAHITIKTKQQICERGEEENAKLKAEINSLQISGSADVEEIHRLERELVELRQENANLREVWG